MMNPIHTANQLIETYERYLMTRFPLGKTDPHLRKRFRTLLQSPMGRTKLIKGPILEITPPYRAGKSLMELSNTAPEWGGLCEAFAKNQGYDIYRPLFSHQEAALEKSLKQNIVVASGTGSGKTESFLFPVLRHCLQHPGRGVRALLVYPLNALIEDQIDRLAKYLNDTQVTFGKYTGQTPRDLKDADPKERRCKNHLITRQEMRENPPHILITNYTMLEYMLLRPGDAPLLDIRDEQAFRFLVLDEAHSYTGAQGTEVALLLKRLRHRVDRSADDIRYIATSATLGGDDISFAERLFGAEFPSTSLIKGLKVSLSQPLSDHNPLVVSELLHWGLPDLNLEKVELLQRLNAPDSAEDTAVSVWRHLQGRSPLQLLINKLEERPYLLSDLAKQVFPSASEEESQQALVNLVAWADFARDPEYGRPLIPARYHMLVSASKGFFVSLSASAQSSWNQIALNQQDIKGAQAFEASVCRVCGEPYLIGTLMHTEGVQRYKPITDSFFERLESEDEEKAKIILHPEPLYQSVLETFCSICGQNSPACKHGDQAKIQLYRYKARFDERFEDLPDANELLEDQDNVVGESPDISVPKGCIRCGSGRNLEETLVSLRLPNNGVTATLASALYAQSPEMTAEELSMQAQELECLYRYDYAPVIAKGKKLITFSDSRQQAAYFGPYFQVTHNTLVFNQKAVKFIRKRYADEPTEIEEIAEDLNRDFSGEKGPYMFKLAQPAPKLEEKSYFKNETLKKSALRERIWFCLYQFIDRVGASRTGFEGLGIGAVYADFKGLDSDVKIHDLKLNTSELDAFGQLLLFYLRLRNTLTLMPEELIHLNQEDDAYFSERYASVILVDPEDSSKPQSPTRLISEKPNRLQKLICSALKNIKGVQPAIETVNELIRQIYFARAFQRYLERHKKGGYYLNPLKLKLSLANDNGEFKKRVPGGLNAFQACQKCGRLSWIDLNGLCNFPGCEGQLFDWNLSLQSSIDNHYRYWLLGPEQPELRAVEHTAQLHKVNAAKAYQQEFKRGRLNVLSSSTTFEMGIDLGDLSVVFMRNVPPGVANYVQRAGRAGRRPGVSPFVLTYCRNLPHDQFYFQNEQALVNGVVQSPAIVLENPKILRRHVNAVVLSKFMKEHIEQFVSAKGNYISDPLMNQMFESSAENQLSPCEVLTSHWVYEHFPALSDLMREIFISAHLKPAFLDNVLENYPTIFGEDERYGLRKVVAQAYQSSMDFYRMQIQEATERYLQADSDKNRKQAENDTAYFGALLRQEQQSQLIAHLAGRGFLPSYSFPHDVVPLKVLENHKTVEEIDLTRELNQAISEYAPGAQVVANSRIHRSGALWKYPKQEFPKYYYYVCKSCDFFVASMDDCEVRDKKKFHLETCSERSFQMNKSSKVALSPQWGFSTLRDEKSQYIRTHTQLQRGGSSSDLYIGQDSNESGLSESLTIDSPMVCQLTYFSGYKMFRINEGPFNPGEQKRESFQICLTCGREYSEKHVPPFSTKGIPCQRPKKQSAALISTFDTDIVKLQFQVLSALPQEVQLSSSPYKARAFWRTFLYSLLEAMSRSMNIARSDLNGQLQFTIQAQPILVLMDTVSGGAGHVARLVGKGGEDMPLLMNNLFVTALNILNCGDCSADSACYTCLFHYTNQKYHHTLNRGLVRDWLNGILN